MTRVNLISPMCLYDQHLIAEWREIPRIVSLVKKLLQTKGSYDILKDVPVEYVLGKGHVNFFKDKLLFIKIRHDALKAEGARRGMNLESITISLEGVPSIFLNDYKCSEVAMKLNIHRLEDKIKTKPKFYKYKSLAHLQLPQTSSASLIA